MQRYWLVVGLLLLLFLVLFLLVETARVPLLTDPASWLQRPGPLAAILSVGFLVVDVVLPMPSSLIMIANGALFGVVGGTLLSVIGTMGAAIVGFVLGRRSEALLARFVSPAEQAQGDKLLHQWGTLAILVTRPVPLLGETVMIMAGASTLRWKPVMLAALAGSLPRALLYALAGTVSTSFQHSSLVFGSMLLLAGVFWGMSKLIRVRLSDRIS